MSADNSCGEPQWFYDRLKQRTVPNPYEKAAIDQDTLEIDRLNREIMRMKVYIQGLELDDLQEKHFREMNPAVKDAWDQYQTVLRLTKEG